MFGSSSQKADPRTRYAFVLEYFDKVAEMTRKYQLLYFPSDETIAMMDMKTRKNFLKRCKYPVKLENLYVGCYVTIYSRQMRVISYGDEFTKSQFSHLSEKTLVLVKPDGEKILGKVISKITSEGLKITKLVSIQLNQAQAKQFYQSYENDALYYKMVDFLISGSVYVMEVVGPGCIDLMKGEVCESIRCKYGSSEIQDVLYCSETSGSALLELEFFFDNNGKCLFPTTARFQNTTLCLIKPHIFHNNLTEAGKIIQHVLDGGFFIEAIELVQMDKTNAADFLEVYKGVVQDYEGMVKEYSDGDMIAMEISHSRYKQSPDQIVDAFRQFCGPLDPQVAKVLRKDTIRAKYGRNKVQNAVHATDLEVDGYLEVEFFFKILRM